MDKWSHIQGKVLPWPALADRLKEWRTDGQKIVFTNGCFDLLHLGHISYLARARSLGDRLVIGLNSSESVSRLKGPHRPLQDESSRATILAALEVVDAVSVFNEDTPLELIKIVHPDYLVKGGDWSVDQIVGADWVMAYGGQVHSLPFIEGYSTTAIEEKIKKQSK